MNLERTPTLTPSPRRRFLILGLAVVATILITPLVGSSGVPLERVLWSLRAPRLVMGMLAGAALSLAGATFQASFRNPLATPFTLGVSSGASLFVALGVLMGIGGGLWAFSAQMGFAFLGALLVTAVVYAIARKHRGASRDILLLTGVSIAFVCMSGIVLLQALANEVQTWQIVRWMMGSIEVVGQAGWIAMIPCALVVGFATVFLFRLHRELDLILLGELVAVGRGVAVERVRTQAYFAASAMTAAVVALCGPIAFVGLIVPHIMRAIFGPGHATLLPGCLLGGMVFLPLCDLLARNLLSWMSHSGLMTAIGLAENYRELPVGVLTSLLGGVFFLMILLRRSAVGTGN